MIRPILWRRRQISKCRPEITSESADHRAFSLCCYRQKRKDEEHSDNSIGTGLWDPKQGAQACGLWVERAEVWVKGVSDCRVHVLLTSVVSAFTE